MKVLSWEEVTKLQTAEMTAELYSAYRKLTEARQTINELQTTMEELELRLADYKESYVRND